MNLFKKRVHVTLALVVAIGSHQALAAPSEDFINAFVDYQSLIDPRTAEFGDRIDTYTGRLSVRVVDVSIPGNGPALTIARRYAYSYYVGRHYGIRYWTGDVGTDWSLETPYVQGYLRLHLARNCNNLGNWFANDASGEVAYASFGGLDGASEVLSNLGSPPAGYTLTSARGYVAKCIDAVEHYTNGTTRAWPSMGMEVRAPDGTVYTLDRIQLRGDHQERDDEGNFAYVGANFEIFASRVTDRNGNTLNYEYTADPNGQQRLVAITASDGRRVDLEYSTIGTGIEADGGSAYILNTYGYDISYNGHPSVLTAIHSGDRTWSYQYQTWTGTDIYGPPNGERYNLTKVIKPDGSEWNYRYNGPGNMPPVDPGGDYTEHYLGNLQLDKITNPLGGTVEYDYAYFAVPNYISGNFRFHGVQKRTTADSAVTYSYVYSAANERVTMTVNRADGRDVYVHWTPGNTYWYLSQLQWNKRWALGSLMSRTTYPFGGSTALESAEYSWDGQIVPNPNLRAININTAVCGFSCAPLMTQERITRDGTDYTTTRSAFSNYLLPGTIVETSNGPSRTIGFTYRNDVAKWLIGLPTQVTVQANGQISSTSNDYDANGNLTSSIVDGQSTTYSYHADGNLFRVTDALSNITQFTDYHRGSARRVDQADGTYITRQVDDYGQVTRRIDALGRVFDYAYDEIGRLESVDLPGPTTEDISVVWTQPTIAEVRQGDFTRRIELDGYGRESRVSDLGSGSVLRHRQTLYNGAGRKSRVSDWAAAGVYIPMAAMEYQYDAIGRVTMTRRATDIYGTGDQEFRSYLSGNRIQIVDPRNNTRTLTFQRFGDPDDDSRVTRIEMPPATTTEIAYGVLGQMLTHTQGSVTRVFNYDSQYRLISEQHPESGTTTYTRDALGRMQTRTQAGQGMASVFTYDPMGRVSLVDHEGSADDLDFDYDANGNVIQVSNPSGGITWGYSYDELNRLKTEQLNASGIFLPMVYDRDGRGNVFRVTTPRGVQVDLDPDALGRPSRVGPYVTQIAYHPNDEISSMTFGNGVVQNFGLDAHQRVGTVSVDNLTGALVRLTYGYDANGNVQSIADGLISSRSVTLGYDAANRLISAIGPWGGASYAYDGLGNLTNIATGYSTNSYGYTASNRLEQVTGVRHGPGQAARNLVFQYDARGNVISDGEQAYGYGAAGYMTSMSGGVTFANDYRGYRVKVTSGSTHSYNFYSLAGQLIGTYGADGAFDTEYVNLNGRPVAAVRNAPSRALPPSVVTGLAATPLDPYLPPIMGIALYKGSHIGAKDGRVRVTWQNGGGVASAYVIERSATPGFAVIAEAVTVTGALEHTFQSLPTGVHYVRARACNISGCSTNTAAAQAVEVAPPPPAPAIQFSGTEGTSSTYGYPMDSNASHLVSWTVVAGATSYELYRGAMFPVGPAILTGTSTQAGPYALTDGNYAYSVVACAGNGCASSAGGGLLTVAAAPAIPTAIFASPSSSTNGSFAVTWQQPAGGTVSLTEVWESTNGTSFTKLTTSEPATTQNRRYDATRTNGTYYYQVRACNSVGACSAFSSTSAPVTVSIPTGPGVPSNFMANPEYVDPNQTFVVSWNTVSGTGISYELQQSATSAFTSATTFSQAGTSKSFSKGNVTEEEKYFFYRVRACTTTQCSAYSAPVMVTIAGQAPGNQ